VGIVIDERIRLRNFCSCAWKPVKEIGVEIVSKSE
jgi:hypothetical protein